MNYHTYSELLAVEEMEIFILWHFYGGNGAMARGLSRWWNFLVVAKNTFWGSSVVVECRMLIYIIPTYVPYFMRIAL